jgi:hypothetical protein
VYSSSRLLGVVQVQVLLLSSGQHEQQEFTMEKLCIKILCECISDGYYIIFNNNNEILAAGIVGGWYIYFFKSQKITAVLAKKICFS